jgi:hypothetical protein
LKKESRKGNNTKILYGEGGKKTKKNRMGGEYFIKAQEKGEGKRAEVRSGKNEYKK